jgi:2-oxoglutarate ferredoxin oxidoreductase subunit beta
MTGGQLAPTTLPGMKTTSSPLGRNIQTMGYPVKMSELLATLEGASYVVRRSVHDPVNINRTKKAIRTAFEAQLKGLGFSLVEVLSSCPVNWDMTPKNALKYLKETMAEYYPLGDYKVIDALKQQGQAQG